MTFEDFLKTIDVDASQNMLVFSLEDMKAAWDVAWEEGYNAGWDDAMIDSAQEEELITEQQRYSKQRVEDDVFLRGIESQQAEIKRNIEAKIVASYKWISIKEKLPEKNTYVLMAASSGFVTTTFYTEPQVYKNDCKVSAWFEHANNYAYEVTHWMPLPKAPTQESE